jgi:hypothetical protein
MLRCCSNKTLLVFKDAAAYQVIYMGSHLPKREAHLVPIERSMENGRRQFGNRLWNGLATLDDFGATILMMLLQLLDPSTRPVKRGIVAG